ncbi:MAG: glycosyltransferase family 4 protein [Mycobacteriales bacterium]|nr:undecaprenyl/decaprenyl-phosphate alpha-N-acetylglucosaminyl 1-phosphate transferase [Frankia sp.]
MREYSLVFAVAAAVTYLLTPLVRRGALRWHALAQPRDRDVHAIPTPRLGGVAMYAGVVAALLVARALPALSTTFKTSSDPRGVLIGGALICGIGVLDDRWGLDALTKLAGQILSAGVMVLLGVQLLFIWLPTGTLYSLDQNLAVPATVLLALAMVNSVNVIDGLDGLAAGVVAIAAAAFFAFSYQLSVVQHQSFAAPSTLICAVLVGVCVGFLPHNFNPARIFMGDSGSMLIGLMLAAATTSATTRVDYGALSGSNVASFFVPILLPALVLLVPFVDLLLAIVRRMRAGRPVFSPDKEHLHHRLLEIGHSHRRAVLIMYFWSALIAFGGVAVSFTRPALVLSVVAAFAIIALLSSSLPKILAARRL